MALRSLFFALVIVGGLSNDAFAASQFDLAHGQFTAVLQSSVIVNGAESRVNYRRLKEDPNALNAYVAALSTVSKREFEGFSQAERLAFLINAYNAFTLKLVVDHYPVESIRDIGGLFSSPWKIKFFTLLGEERSLNEIEHELIRKQFREPKSISRLFALRSGAPRLEMRPTWPVN